MPTVGAYGRRPAKNARAMLLATILTGVVPSHPLVQDNLGALKNWAMLGNDRAGDCVAVTWANFRRLMTAVLGGSEHYPVQDLVWALYKTQNPGFNPLSSTHGPGSNDDQGMDIQTALEYLHDVGMPDSTGGPNVKVVAFAKVDPKNLDEVKAAIAIFGGLWTGINVKQANEDQFSQGTPWDYVASSPDAGGHSIISGGYKATTSSDVTFITWATETSFTDMFWLHQVEEAWAVIWPENLGTKQFEVGISSQALVDAYAAVTNGKVLVIPPVTPPVTPPPVTPPSGGNPFPDLPAATLAAIQRLAAARGMTPSAYLAYRFPK